MEAPQKAVRDVPNKPRRKESGQKTPPLPTMKQLLTVECPACGREPGDPCTLRQGHRARVEMYRAATGKGSSPEAVRAAVQRGAEALEDKRAARSTVTSEERAQRAAQSAAAKEASRRKGSRGNPYKSANTRAVSPEQVTALRCPACAAPAGEPCAARRGNGQPAFHIERQQAARVVLQRTLDA
ncbi:hypothetical protein ACFWII_39040 [Streptomyces sp. NPDC127063]|uniref:zinc finger domain-containing protein n=1 Tax=Streptomyces sp. NPDC127063 TaxID=3347123 RepID=UPI00364B7DAF